MKQSEIKIDRRKIYEQKIEKILSSGEKKTYIQYRMTLPAKFAKKHVNEEVYLVADSVGLIVRDEETLMKILEKFPDLRKFVLQRQQKKRRKKK